MSDSFTGRASRPVCVGVALATLAISALASPQSALADPSIATLLSVRDPILVPTKPGFAKSLIGKLVVGIRSGLLNCASATVCNVNGMPLLAQGDPRLDPVLMDYLKGIADDALPVKVDASGKPTISPSGSPVRYTRQELVDGWKDFGCYDTSIATLNITALANKSKDLANPPNRTGEFDNVKQITASNGVVIPKEVNQEIWQYERSFEAQNGYAIGGKPVPAGGKPAQVMYVREVAADVGNKITQNCDPYNYTDCDNKGFAEVDGRNDRTSAFRSWIWAVPNALSNGKIINLMQSGTVSLVAYTRFKTVATFNPKDGSLNVTFGDQNSLHKVPFSGFQSLSQYPLTINDVGNGTRYRVRVSSNLAEMAFSKLPNIPTAAVKKVIIDPAFAGKSYIAYEGADASEVFFIQTFDGLHIDTAPRITVGTTVPPLHTNKFVPIPQPDPGPEIHALPALRQASR